MFLKPFAGLILNSQKCD